MKKSIALKNVAFETTSRCNLDCRYCYNIHKCPGGPEPKKIEFGMAIRTLKRLFKMADTRQITMTGGEPFMSDRFLELVLFCRMRGKRVAIITNGTKGSPEEYRQLVEMGVRTFELPLHSEAASVHDAMANRTGSFDRVRASIDTLLELGADVIPVIVATRLNAKDVGNTLNLCHRLGLGRVMVNRFNVGGRGIANEAELGLGPDDLVSLFTEVNSVARVLGLKVTSNVCTPFCVIDPDRFPYIGFSSCSPEIERRPLTLDALGNLRFCNHSPVDMGNIFEQSLETIFATPYARGWRTSVPAICKGCSKWTRCYGGCRAAAEQIGMTLAHPDPIISYQGAMPQSLSPL